MLQINQLFGFGVGGGSGLLVPTYRDISFNNADQTTYTFSTQNIGTASGDRFIAVCAGGRQTTSRSIDSCTVAGQSTTLLVSSSGLSHVAIFLTDAPVISGTTATIEVTFSASTARCGIGVYSITGTGGVAPVAAETSTSTTSMNIFAGGVLLGSAYEISGANISWTGLTEGAEASLEGPNQYAVASNSSATKTSVTASANGDRQCFVSLRPA